MKGRPTGPPIKKVSEQRLSKGEQLLFEAMRPVQPPPPRTPEERVRLRALMQRYSRLKCRQMREMQVRYREAQRGMWAAIDALPHVRRIEAINAEAEDYPEATRVFTDTPLIKGFDKANLAKKV